MTDTNHLIYPIFLQCSNYCDDQFWINIFTNLAYGVTPYGSYFYKNSLNYKTKTAKIFSCIVDMSTDPHTLYTEVYELIHSAMGVISPSQRLEMHQEFDSGEDRNRTDWSVIKKKNIKDMLIDLYAIKVMTEHNRSMEDTRTLRGFICTALTFKALTASDITMMDGRIESIKGIDFDDNGDIIHTADIYITDTEDTQIAPRQRRTSMSLHWMKYLDNLSFR